MSATKDQRVAAVPETPQAEQRGNTQLGETEGVFCAFSCIVGQDLGVW